MMQITDTSKGSEKISVVIVDDHRMVADAVCGYLEMAGDFLVLACCDTAEKGVEAVLTLQPDVVLMDLQFPKTVMSGIDAVRAILSSNPQIRILVISGYCDPQFVIDAVAAGVQGYLEKDADPEEIVRAVRQSAAGLSAFGSRPMQIVRQHLMSSATSCDDFSGPGDSPDKRLTPREWEVLELLAQGQSNAQIAHALVVSESTIKTHVSSIYAALGLSGRERATLWYNTHRHRRPR